MPILSSAFHPAAMTAANDEPETPLAYRGPVRPASNANTNAGACDDPTRRED
jgi:hypothetical protein